MLRFGNKNKKVFFHFVLLSPFTIFADILVFSTGLEYKRRNHHG